MNETRELIGGAVFSKIETDERVTADLDYCLYCSVYDLKTSKYLDFKIRLDCMDGNAIKNCPACKRIYILKDPIERE